MFHANTPANGLIISRAPLKLPVKPRHSRRHRYRNRYRTARSARADSDSDTDSDTDARLKSGQVSILNAGDEGAAEALRKLPSKPATRGVIGIGIGIGIVVGIEQPDL